MFEDINHALLALMMKPRAVSARLKTLIVIVRLLGLDPPCFTK